MARVKDRRLNQTELAKYFECSQQAISAQSRLPGAPQKGADGKYSLLEWIAFRKQQAELDKSKPTGSYAEEIKAKTAAQRALLELELEVKRGRLIDRDTVEMQQRQFVQVVQSDLLNMPAPLAMMLEGKGRVEMESEIKGYVRRLFDSWRKLAKESGKDGAND